jgi:hypothetical protein
MTVLTDNTKVNHVDAAFAELVAGDIREGRTALAEKTLKVFATLPPDSKVRLYDLLTK